MFKRSPLLRAGQLLAANDGSGGGDPANVAVFLSAFALTTLGIIYVQVGVYTRIGLQQSK
jgi:hypothetical protein